MSIAVPAPKERLARPVDQWVALMGNERCQDAGVGGRVLAAGAHTNKGVQAEVLVLLIGTYVTDNVCVCQEHGR